MKKIIMGIFIICIGVSIFFSLPKKTPPKEEPIKEEITTLEKVKNLLPEEDQEFLNWIDEKYPKSLEPLLQELEDKEFDKSMWHQVTGYSYLVLQDFYQNKYENLDNIKNLGTDTKTIRIIGDVSLADNWHIMPKYYSSGKGVYGILSEDVLELMRSSDLMIANSEFTVSNRGSAMPGKLYTFRAKPERLKIYEEMGVDMVTLANNHVYDFGQEAFLDMLDAFDEYQIPRIGAGRNLEEAMKPYYFIIGGYKFAFVNATRAEKYILTPGATETSEGVFRCYDPTNMIHLIESLRPENDYVIAIIHYGKEGYHELEKEQIESSHQYIAATMYATPVVWSESK